MSNFQNESLGVFSCSFSAVPEYCFLVHQESIKLDIGELQKFPDLERHRLCKSEQIVRLHGDNRIAIGLSANAIQENGDMIIMVSVYQLEEKIHLMNIYKKNTLCTESLIYVNNGYCRGIFGVTNIDVYLSLLVA